MKRKVVFVLGAVSRRAKEEGQAITDADLATLEKISDRANVDAELVFACQERATHGKKPTMKQVRAERPRLVAAIAETAPDLVVAFGPVALAAVMDKGGLKLTDMRFKGHRAPDVLPGVRIVDSLEKMAFQTGLKGYAAIDILRGLAGEIPPQLGEYHVQTEIHPALAVYLAGGGRELTADLETFPGTNPYAPDARIRMVILSHVTGWAQVVQCGPASEIPGWVRDLLSDPSVLKAGSNIRFDVRWLRRFGYAIENFVCTQHTEHLLDENCGIKDLKTLALKYHPTLGDYAADQHRLVEERSVYEVSGRKGQKRKKVEDGWRHIKDEEMYPYAGGDGDAGITIYHEQKRRVAAEGMERPYRVLQEYYPAITQIELAGACVDMAENKALHDRYAAEIARLKNEIRGHLGSSINPASPLQLVGALQELVPGINLKKTMFGRRDPDEDEEYSTAAFVLKREAARHPVIGTVLEFRRRDSLFKFVKGMSRHVVRVNGRDYVFSSIRGDITGTYRHSSSKPNLQNLPRTVEAETELGLNVKRQYVSRFEGGTIMEFDYSQLELRVAGMLGNVAALKEAFASGVDVHTMLAAMMRGIRPEEVTKEIRQNGKTTNFHVLYGGGAFGLSLRLGCDRFIADNLVRQFDALMPEYRAWEKARHREIMTRGYVESMFGFRRRFDAPPDWNTPDGRRIKRQAGNAPIQGSAGQITNLGIVAALKLLDGFKSVPFMTVHDSLLVDVYPGEEEDIRQLCTYGMEFPNTTKYGVELSIPLVVDCKGGPNWGQMEDIK